MSLTRQLSRSLHMRRVLDHHAVQSAFRDLRVTDEASRPLREQRVSAAVLRALEEIEQAANLPPDEAEAAVFCTGCGDGAPGWIDDPHGPAGDPASVIPCPTCWADNDADDEASRLADQCDTLHDTYREHPHA